MKLLVTYFEPFPQGRRLINSSKNYAYALYQEALSHNIDCEILELPVLFDVVRDFLGLNWLNGDISAPKAFLSHNTWQNTYIIAFGEAPCKNVLIEGVCFNHARGGRADNNGEYLIHNQSFIAGRPERLFFRDAEHFSRLCPNTELNLTGLGGYVCEAWGLRLLCYAQDKQILGCQFIHVPAQNPLLTEENQMSDEYCRQIATSVCRASLRLIPPPKTCL